jgi:hypothetical protein
MVEYVLPSDPQLRTVYGGCENTRAYNMRLKRAERKGLLPKRVFLSSVRFAYRRAELEAALANLPRDHAATL